MRKYCTNITELYIGKKIELQGWVHKIRNHGGLIFIDLRDISGLIQIIFQPENKQIFQKVLKLKNEYIIKIIGLVKKRPVKKENIKSFTGKLEIIASKLVILAKSFPLPFPVNKYQDLNEDIRFTYRYIDLRRFESQKYILLRSKVTNILRSFLEKKKFIDIETPILTKSSPEGARDYIVPSRIHKKCYFALPQSPQLFKQLLMISGFDKYYQIAKCFRDEDLRANRQPEFTQLDIEMSFIQEKDIINFSEKLIKFVFKKVMDIDFKDKFPCISYKESLLKYGTDKPDIRIPLVFHEIKELFQYENHRYIKKYFRDKNSRIVALKIPNGNKIISRKVFKFYKNFVLEKGSENLSYIKVLSIKKSSEFNIKSSLDKIISNTTIKNILQKIKTKVNDFIFLIADKEDIVNTCFNALRRKIGKDFNLYSSQWAPIWIINFPMFKKNKINLESVHHPFTSPSIDNIEDLNKIPLEKILSRSYDIVINGSEIGSGSIRINCPNMQKAVFHLLGMNNKEIEQNFGFFINALKFGAPPHGGIGIGLDRFIMLLSKTNNIRDVIPFPKTQNSSCFLTKAPSFISKNHLNELSIFYKK